MLGTIRRWNGLSRIGARSVVPQPGHPSLGVSLQRVLSMASAARNKKNEKKETDSGTDGFRRQLEELRTRLRGDLDQMTDEALNRSGSEVSGGLSSAPIHMADLGTDAYEQEFTLSLIENEQETLDEVYAAIDRLDRGVFGACEECQKPIAKARLEAIPYVRHCIECARLLQEGR